MIYILQVQVNMLHFIFLLMVDLVYKESVFSKLYIKIKAWVCNIFKLDQHDRISEVWTKLLDFFDVWSRLSELLTNPDPVHVL